MTKKLIKEFVSHDLSFGLVSEDFDRVCIYSVDSWYEVEYSVVSPSHSRMELHYVYKYSEFRLAMYDFMSRVNSLLPIKY